MIKLSRRDLRLASGLVLFSYVTLHLSCHALGLVSLDAAEAGLRSTVLLWHSGPGTLLLYGAAAAHVGLAFAAIYDRRTLRMAPLHALRIVLGLIMPLALIGHVVGTRYAFERFALPSEYSRVAANLWAAGAQGLSLGLLAPGWLHGCLGLRFAFGHRRAWQQWRFALFGVALLLPVLAGLGFVVMGRELVAAQAARVAVAAPPNALQREALTDMREAALATYLALLGCIALARAWRGLDERRRRAIVRIAYPGRSVTVPRGWSVLEASRNFGIAHPSMCGGRARCSTCRVRIIEGHAHCPPTGAEEQRTLARIGGTGTLRLACQLRPTGDIAIEPVLAVEPSRWGDAPMHRPTTECDAAVLFFEVRFGGGGAPRGNASAHDTIYALDRFHAIVGTAIDQARGVTCSRAGDRWVALFGLDGALREGCGQALVAAGRIEEQATALIEQLMRELDLRAEISLGIHAGPVVVGMLGTGETRTLSAVGDAIDAAQQMQAAAARAALRFVISRSAVLGAGIDAATLTWRPAGEEGEDADPADATRLCADASAAGLAAQLARVAREGS